MAKKPAITGLARPQGIVDDIVKAGVKRVMRVANKLPNKENKLAKKYAKERVVIQKKYDAQIAGDKGAQRAIKYAEIDAILKKKTAARRAGGSKF
jgi:hypothetical protein